MEKVVPNLNQSGDSDFRRERLKCHSPLPLLMVDVDWGEVRRVASKDVGRVRGVYALEDVDRKELLKLIQQTDGHVVLPIATVRAIFYRGSGEPSAAAAVIALKKHFGDEFTFGVRASGEKIVIGFKKEK